MIQRVVFLLDVEDPVRDKVYVSQLYAHSGLRLHRVTGGFLATSMTKDGEQRGTFYPDHVIKYAEFEGDWGAP